MQLPLPVPGVSWQSIQRKQLYLEESIDLVLDALLASGVEHFLEAVVPGQDKKIR